MSKLNTVLGAFVRLADEQVFCSFDSFRMTILSSSFSKIGSYSIVIALTMSNGPPVAYAPDRNTIVLTSIDVNLFVYTNVTLYAYDAAPAWAHQVSMQPPTMCQLGHLEQTAEGNIWINTALDREPFPDIMTSNKLRPFYPITNPSQLKTMIPSVVSYVTLPIFKEFDTVMYNTTLYMPPLVRPQTKGYGL